MNEIVIIGAARTPLGAFLGALANVPATQLGAVAIRGALLRAKVAPGDVTDCFMGNVIGAGLGQAPARQAALAAGLPATTLTVTLNKVCGSGLQALWAGAQALATGSATLVVAGGMENMSAAPHLLPRAREGWKFGHAQILDALLHDGLWDPHHGQPMGKNAETCAAHYAFTREAQDAYASESFRRANAAQAAGHFAAEITPVEVVGAKGVVTSCEHDEGPAKVRYEKISTLKPAFQPDGTITAANASTLNDGAAALVLTTAATARACGLVPIARIVSFGAHAQEPLWFTTTPVVAARQALDRAGWTEDEVDLWEINEAFAVVPMAFMRELGVSPEKVNVRGGAIALGHPLGASGARIVVTLLAALRERGLRRGVAAICIGGGEGLAVAVEIQP